MCDMMLIDDLFRSSSDDIEVAFIDDEAIARSHSSQHVPDGEASAEKQRSHHSGSKPNHWVGC